MRQRRSAGLQSCCIADLQICNALLTVGAIGESEIFRPTPRPCRSGEPLYQAVMPIRNLVVLRVTDSRFDKA